MSSAVHRHAFHHRRVARRIIRNLTDHLRTITSSTYSKASSCQPRSVSLCYPFDDQIVTMFVRSMASKGFLSIPAHAFVRSKDAFASQLHLSQPHLIVTVSQGKMWLITVRLPVQLSKGTIIRKRHMIALTTRKHSIAHRTK